MQAEAKAIPRMMSQGTAGQQSHKATNLDWRRMMKGVRKVISGKNTRSGGSVWNCVWKTAGKYVTKYFEKISDRHIED